MDDIAPELLKKIKNDFRLEYADNDLIRGLFAKVRSGTATYKEANEFAIELGNILARAYKNNLSSNVLPDGKMYYNIAKSILNPTLENNYNLITNVTNQIQKSLNHAAGIGIKPIKPKLNQDRIDGIINRVSSEDVFDDAAWILDEPVKNFSQSIVDDSIRVNSEFHAKAGLQPVITRKLMGGCCDWCRELAGTYPYPDVPKDIYRRHQRCRCTVDYIPQNGKIQNVHTKKWLSAEEKEKFEFRKTIGLRDERQMAAQRIQKVEELNSKLTAHQEDAINQYISSSSYNINEKLRQNLPLTDEENVFIINMDKALDKMPKYEGDLTRSLFFDYENDLNNFLEKHQVGNVVEYPAYTSTTFGNTYNPNGQVQLYIFDSKKGRNISSFNNKEKEVLYQRNSDFVVERIYKNNNKTHILLKEV